MMIMILILFTSLWPSIIQPFVNNYILKYRTTSAVVKEKNVSRLPIPRSNPGADGESVVSMDLYNGVVNNNGQLQGLYLLFAVADNVEQTQFPSFTARVNSGRTPDYST